MGLWFRSRQSFPQLMPRAFELSFRSVSRAADAERSYALWQMSSVVDSLSLPRCCYRAAGISIGVSVIA